MFKRSRKKIVAAIMSILVILFLGTLAIIYGSSYFEVSATNYKMLEQYARLYYLEKQAGDTHLESPDIPASDVDRPKDSSEDDFRDKPVDKPGDISGDNPRNNPDAPRFNDTPAFYLATFYSVAISYSGDIRATDNGNGAIYEDEILEQYALEIVQSGKNKGIKENLIYIITDKGGYHLVVFMDNTIMQQSMTTLFRYTFFFGSLTLVALFFVALYLAKRIVKPLEESYQKQKQFISDAGHELKTPVSVVSANAEILSREIGENQWLANIQYENERIGKLVQQLLELARTENTVPEMQRLDFSRLVAGEALPFESVAFEKGLVLNCDIADGLSINGNSGQLKQMVSILIDNAICHSSGGKEITLRLKAERNHARLFVINEGEAILPEQREHLFDRFYRIDAARNGEDKHYGLGLAIAKAIVTAHKGKISVTCYDGKVEFSVRMPIN